MARTLFIIAALALVFLIIKNRIASRRLKQQQHQGTTKGDADDLVQCAQCRTRVPAREAVSYSAHSFCCPQHQRDWQKRQQQD